MSHLPHNNDAIAKIFRLALVLFATTLGVGAYALIGAPVRRMGSSPLIENIGSGIKNAGASVANIFASSDDRRHKNDIIINLTADDNGYITLKSTLIDATFAANESRNVRFTADGQELGMDALLTRISKTQPPADFLRAIGDGRYFMQNDKKYHGTLVISVLDNELARASLIQWESGLLASTLPLVHPLVSNGEINMYKELGLTSRNIASTDARVIKGAKGEVLYIWGIYKDMLIIAGTETDYTAMVDILSK